MAVQLAFFVKNANNEYLSTSGSTKAWWTKDFSHAFVFNSESAAAEWIIANQVNAEVVSGAVNTPVPA